MTTVLDARSITDDAPEPPAGACIEAHGVSRTTNVMLFHTRDEGLLPGPYHPEYLKGQ